MKEKALEIIGNEKAEFSSYLKKYKIVVILVMIELVLSIAGWLTGSSNLKICTITGAAILGMIIEYTYSNYQDEQEEIREKRVRQQNKLRKKEGAKKQNNRRR